MSHFKTSVAYIRRAPFQAMAAMSVLILTFFVGTLLAILVYSSGQVLTHFETRPQVIAFVKNDATDAQVDGLREKLLGDERVEEISYVSREQALDIYKEATSNNPLLGELVSPSIFPASVEFSLSDLKYAEELIDEVKNNEIVENVGFTASLGDETTLSDVVERLRTATLYVRIGGTALISVLGFASFLVLMVVVGMRITTRRREVDTLSLLGATAGFIRAPIVIETLIYGVLGVLIGWLLAVILLLYATPSIISYFGEIPVLPRDTLSFFGLLGIILVVEMTVGVIIALSGSLVSVSRALRRK